MALLFFFFIPSAEAQNDVQLPAVGGGGGSGFVARCPEGKVLTGFDMRAGDVVDAVSPLCVTDYGLYSVSGPETYPSKAGGDGGNAFRLLCSDHYTKPITIPLAPIVLGMYIGSEGRNTVSVNRIHLICGVADPGEIENVVSEDIRGALVRNELEPPSARFDGRASYYPGPNGEQRCPAGMVAVGIHGHSGVWVDALGLICGAPRFAPRPGSGGNYVPPTVTLGRVPSTTPKGPPLSICARARDARRRDSPAAPALEAECSVYLESHPLEDPRTVLARSPSPIRVNTGALVSKTPDVNAPAAKGPAITAGSNPVIVPAGRDSGTTTISWKAAPDFNYSEIYLSVDNGEWSEFARGADGSKSAMIRLGSSYTFRMMVYEGQAGTPRIIATYTLWAVRR
jgi:hypothetical protein